METGERVAARRRWTGLNDDFAGLRHQRPNKRNGEDHQPYQKHQPHDAAIDVSSAGTTVAAAAGASAVTAAATAVAAPAATSTAARTAAAGVRLSAADTRECCDGTGDQQKRESNLSHSSAKRISSGNSSR